MLDDGSFTLINNLKEKLTKKESVERIATHFASISQEYPPICIENLPDDVQIKLSLRCDEKNCTSLA